MIKFKFADGVDLPVPKRETEYSAGFDLRYSGKDDVIIRPMEFKILPTGIHVKIPHGYVGLFCSRSGLAAKYGLFVLNSPGIIDSDYRGEIKNILANFGSSPYTVVPGERFGQLIIVEVGFAHQQVMQLVDKLDETDRGYGGFGSTGKN